jgi:hypothetical protein
VVKDKLTTKSLNYELNCMLWCAVVIKLLRARMV